MLTRFFYVKKCLKPVLTKENISPLEILKKVSGKDFNLCPVCGIGHLIRPSPTW